MGSYIRRDSHHPAASPLVSRRRAGPLSCRQSELNMSHLRSAGPNNLSSTVEPPLSLKTAAPVRVRPPERRPRNIVKENVLSQTQHPTQCSRSFTQEELADKFVEAMAH